MDQLKAYRVLQVLPGAGEDEIRDAFARLSREFHPEEHPEEFQEVQEAYRILRRRPGRRQSPVSRAGERQEPHSGFESGQERMLQEEMGHDPSEEDRAEEESYESAFRSMERRAAGRERVRSLEKTNGSDYESRIGREGDLEDKFRRADSLQAGQAERPVGGEIYSEEDSEHLEDKFRQMDNRRSGRGDAGTGDMGGPAGYDSGPEGQTGAGQSPVRGNDWQQQFDRLMQDRELQQRAFDSQQNQMTASFEQARQDQEAAGQPEKKKRFNVIQILSILSVIGSTSYGGGMWTRTIAMLIAIGILGVEVIVYSMARKKHSLYFAHMMTSISLFVLLFVVMMATAGNEKGSDGFFAFLFLILLLDMIWFLASVISMIAMKIRGRRRK